MPSPPAPRELQQAGQGWWPGEGKEAAEGAAGSAGGPGGECRA